MKLNILGVKIDNLPQKEALNQATSWLHKSSKHYIVTPNIEFIMLAQTDSKFKEILNSADLAIPDSARLAWAHSELNQKNLILKLLNWPLFVYPRSFKDLSTVTGTDLMSDLIKEASQKGFSVGFLGGQAGVAQKLRDKLLKKYPDLKITFAEDGGKVDEEGDLDITIPKTDLLFVAFGQGKQEKWIHKNLATQPVKVMMGVGGAFDYLSGEVLRAPVWMRSLGLEWLFRLILQPWRIKRFGNLVKFVFLVLTSHT